MAQPATSADGKVKWIRDSSSCCIHLSDIQQQNYNILMCSTCSPDLEKGPENIRLHKVPDPSSPQSKPFYVCRHTAWFDYQCHDRSFLCSDCKTESERERCYKDRGSRVVSKTEPPKEPPPPCQDSQDCNIL